MWPSGVRISPWRPSDRAPGYLARARALCVRAEALGGRLVAWTSASFAIAWDDDSIEEAVTLAVGVRDEAVAPSLAWSCGIAEGALEPLDVGDARVALSWGEALVASVALARAARPGEVLVDGDVRAVRAGQLTVDGARWATDSGERVRGWRLDLEAPWRGVDTSPTPLESFDDEAATAEVLRMVDEVADAFADDEEEAIATLPAPPMGADSVRDRQLCEALRSGSAVRAAELLPELRRGVGAAAGQAGGRARFELAVALCLAGRRDAALLATLEALSCARASADEGLGSACLALLAKLYSQAGWPDAGRQLGELARAPGPLRAS